jgi:hypothetical protein
VVTAGSSRTRRKADETRYESRDTHPEIEALQFRFKEAIARLQCDIEELTKRLNLVPAGESWLTMGQQRK